jgi:molecular chaperone DnaK (HSP70)
MNEQLTKVFGIDLGTTYSCIAYVDEHGKPVVVQNADSERITPSVVFFDTGNSIIVGQTAKENAKLYPEQVVAFVKRAMGDPNFLFEYDSKEYRPEEISSYILKKLVNDAEQNLGEKITDVVITCPAYFGINEREATKQAGEIAGLTVRQVLNEPTAAAITYGMTETQNKVVLVYDLGGGTFDVTMIHIQPDSIDVICTGGDHNLGGKDWDDRIIQYLVTEFQTETNSSEDILEDLDTWQDLQLAAEKAKKTLSLRDKAPISVTHGGERVKVELTLSKFNELTTDLVVRTINLTNDMLAEARKKGYDTFDELLLVGGSTRMPQIKEQVEQALGIEAKIFDPDEAVAKGAALYGQKLSVNDELIKRIAAETGQTVETVKQTTSSEAIPEHIMQQVANDIGFTLAAVKNATKPIRNVCSKSFGVVVTDRDTGEQTVANLIYKNTTVPIDITERFGTIEDNQENVNIRIMENEVSDRTVDPDDAIELGNAILTIPSHLPAGSPIDITFRLNEEGRLQMNAVEITSGERVETVLETAAVMQEEEIEAAKNRSSGIQVS